MIEMEKTSSQKHSLRVKRKKGKKASHPSVDMVHGRFYDELKFAETEWLDWNDKLTENTLAKTGTRNRIKQYDATQI